MKKILTLTMAFILICMTLAGCSGGQDQAQTSMESSGFSTGQLSGQSDAILSNAGAPAADGSQESQDTAANPEDAALASSDTSSDSQMVDLTTLSSTMVYAEVYNMMYSPESYMGKTIKMSGQYYASYYQETGKYYCFVIVADAAACCQQGLEFIWNGEHAYPDDYPMDGTEIEVTGVFDSYDEDGTTYYCIMVDKISPVSS